MVPARDAVRSDRPALAGRGRLHAPGRLTIAAITMSYLLLQGCHATPTPTPLTLPTPPDPGAPPPLHVAPADAPADPAERSGPRTWTLERVRLGRGNTLAGALDEIGVAPAEAAAVVSELRRHVDPRRLPAATGLAVSRDRSGALRRVGCRAELGRFVRLQRSDGGAWQAEWVELPIETTVETAGGVVEHSVARALAELPDGAHLTLAFADIFQWDVDLLVDPRPGDRVRMVYEVRRLGELPFDLPPFGDDPARSREGAALGPGRILAATYEGRLARSAAFWVADGRGPDGGYYDEAGDPLQKTFLKSPLNYRRISSGFSRARRHPVTRKVVPHHGVDFAAAAGTPVVATADGKVLSAGTSGALGRAIRLRHTAGYQTVYGHLSRFARGIRKGATVRQNQVIGYVGSTGRATGPHLHYTLVHRGRPVNPLTFRNPPAEPLPETAQPLLAEARLRWSPHLASIRPEATVARLSAGDGPPARPGRGT